MFKVDNRVKDLITEFILKNKVLHWGVNIFSGVIQTFGKSIRKVEIQSCSNVNFVLETMLKYFEPATLTEVDMEIILMADYKPCLDVVRRSVPIFSKVRALRIRIASFNHDQSDDYEWYSNFMMAMNLRELEILQLRVGFHGTNKDHGFLGKMQNVRELHFSGPIPTGDIISCISVNPKLISFQMEYKNHPDILAIVGALSKCCPGLETLSFVGYRFWIHDESFQQLHRYEFLSNFSNLKDMTLTSHSALCHDLYHPLTILAPTKIVRLKFFISRDATDFRGAQMRQCNFQGHFVDLRRVDLHCDQDRDGRDDINEGFDFMFNFLTQLENLRTLNLSTGNKQMLNISKFLELRTIQVINIAKVKLRRPPVEIRKIVRQLRKIWKEDQRVMHLIVNVVQSRELLVYKDIEDIATISIESEEFNGIERFILKPKTFIRYRST